MNFFKKLFRPKTYTITWKQDNNSREFSQAFLPKSQAKVIQERLLKTNCCVKMTKD